MTNLPTIQVQELEIEPEIVIHDVDYYMDDQHDKETQAALNLADTAVFIELWRGDL